MQISSISHTNFGLLFSSSVEEIFEKSKKEIKEKDLENLRNYISDEYCLYAYPIKYQYDVNDTDIYVGITDGNPNNRKYLTSVNSKCITFDKYARIKSVLTFLKDNKRLPKS